MARTKKDAQAGVQAIRAHGGLLVFPIGNRPEPKSLWSEFYPRSKMRWEWDQNGDDRVPSLWSLREELSRSGKVVYAKWYQGRATFFSKEAFTLVHAALGTGSEMSLSPMALKALDTLRENSPQSTKELKARLDLRGRDNEAQYQRSLLELWRRLLIVGYGEIDDGAFPSLAIGASEVLFEELVRKARAMEPAFARAQIGDIFAKQPSFAKHLEKLSTALTQRNTVERQPAIIGKVFYGWGK